MLLVSCIILVLTKMEMTINKKLKNKQYINLRISAISETIRICLMQEQSTYLLRMSKPQRKYG